MGTTRRHLSARVLAQVVIAAVIAALFAVVPAVAGAAAAAPERQAADMPATPAPQPKHTPPAAPKVGDFNREPEAGGGVPALPDDVILPAGFDTHGKKVVSRTADSTSYADANGKVTMLLHGGTINWQDERGVWRQIDPRLHIDKDGNAVNGAGPIAVQFTGATGSGKLVSLSTKDWSLGADLPEGAGGRAVTADGPTARYREVFPGVDLEETVGTDQLKEVFTLPKAPPKPLPEVLRTPLTLKGLTPSTAEDGSIEFHDAKGDLALAVPVGLATDSSLIIDDHGVTPRASVVPKLVKTDAGWSIDLQLPTEWLNDPARVYPVYIDPTYTFYAGVSPRQSNGWDESVGSGCGGCYYDGQPNTAVGNYGQVEGSAYVDRIGYENFNGTGQCATGTQYCSYWQFYSYLNWDVSRLMNHSLVTAYFHGHTFQGGSFRTYPVDRAWSIGMGWDTKAGHACSCWIDQSIASNTNFAFDFTGWAANWTNHTWGANGLVMDTAGVNNYVQLAAFEQAWQGFDPYLEINFNDQLATWPSVSQLSPADGTVTTNTTPTLSTPAMSDPEGDPISYWFRVGTDTGAEAGQMINSGWITPGAGQGASFTIPSGALQDGVTYYWKVFTWDGWGPPAPQPPGTPVWSSWPPAKLKLNLRLGDGGPSPMDGAGPVKVNMATGNVTTTVSSPNVPVVGGNLGVSYVYNSQQPQGGLTGAYYKDCNGSTGFPAQPTLVRTDPAVDFIWNGSPAPGVIGSENFCVRWTGQLSVPTSNGWCFDASNDDGMRVWVNGTLVIDRWYDQATSINTVPANCLGIFSDNTVPITIEYYQHLGGAQARFYMFNGTTNTYVPASWLSTTPKTLPVGWTLSAGADALTYNKAVIGTDTVTLMEPDGISHEYRKSSTGAWTPEPGEDSVLTTGTETSGAATYVVHGEDGVTYTFNTKGVLIRAQQPTDDLHPAAPRYDFDVDSGRVSAITDPVSGKQVQLKYSNPNGGSASNCPVVPPSGFDAYPPAGFLCEVLYPDSTHTDLFYVGGLLRRIVDPGGTTTNLVYDSSSRLTQVRDVLANDVVAAGQRADDATTWTIVAYDGSNRASSVTLPAPAAGAARPVHSYRYFSGETKLDVAGVSPTVGYSRRVVFNGAAQTLYDDDSAGVETATTWDNADRPLTKIAANNDSTKSLETTTVYDDAGRPIHSYGPARPSCFTGQTPNDSCANPSVADSATSYDEGMPGLAAGYWNNNSMAGAITSHSTGIGDATGAVNKDWGAGAPSGLPTDNWSMRLTGDVLLPTTGSYVFKLGTVDTGDHARLWVDDTLVVDAWAGGTAWNNTGTFSGTGGTRHRIRIDYADLTGNASIQLLWTPPNSAQAVVPGANLGPRYGLVTTSLDGDNKKTTNEYSAGSIGPEYGITTATVAWVDNSTPLRTVTTYESPSSSTYLRRLTKTLPRFASAPTAANSSTYQYYGVNEAAPTNDCGGVSSLGLIKKDIDPTASDGTAITREYVYDTLNRILGSRVVGDQFWSCRTYDGRGRLTSERDSQGVWTTFVYATDGTVTATFKDSSGRARSTVSHVDFLGRQTSYTDEQGTTTRVVYDQAGRATDSYRTFSGAAETHLMSWGYDPATGRPSALSDYSASQTSPRTTQFGYDTAGRLTTTSRPNGVASTTTFDTATGRVYTLSNKQGTTEKSLWTYGYTTGGRVLSENGAGRTHTFGYDGAGRLTSTDENGTVVRRYAYDANTNRCSTANDCTSPTYTYDNADRLTASPFGSNYQYDSHGNLISATPNATQAAGTLTDSWSYDALSPSTHTIPLTINSNGTLSANLDTTPTATYASGTGSGSVAASGISSAMQVPVRGTSFVRATLTWTQGTGGYAPVTLRLKDATGAVVKSVNGSAGTLDLTYVTPDVTATWTLDVQDTSSTIAVPSFNLPWSATTASTAALSSTLAPGATTTQALTADGQGRLSAAATYQQGVKTVSSTPTGSVAMGGSTTQTVAATGAGTITGSLDWSPLATYAAAAPTGTVAPGATWSGAIPVEGRSYLRADLTWSASPSGLAAVTLRFKDETGAVVKTISDSSGSLGIGFLTPDVAAGYTVEVVDNSTDKSVPSFTLQWTSTTASVAPLSGSLTTGQTATTNLTASGQGNLSAAVSYAQGTKPVSSSPTGTALNGQNATTTVTATGAGPITGSLDWAPAPTYVSGSPSGSLAPSAVFSDSMPLADAAYLKAHVTWTASGTGLASVTLRFKNAAGAVTKSVSGSTGALDLAFLANEGATRDTVEVVDDSTDKNVPSFSLQWSATTASDAPLSGSLATGQTATQPITADGQGYLSANVSYDQGTKPASSSPTASVAAHGTSDQTVNVTGAGAMTAGLDWASLPVYTASNASPSLPAAGSTWSTPVTVKGATEIYGLANWSKMYHDVSTPLSGVAYTWTPGVKSLNVTGQGTITADVDWNTVSGSLSQSASVDPAATWSTTFTSSAAGTVAASISWVNGPVPSVLELSLWDGDTQIATSNTKPGDQSARIPSQSVAWSLSNQKTYTLKVANTGAKVTFSMSGSYPVTPAVNVRLFNPSGVEVASNTTATDKPKRVTYDMVAHNAPTGTYTLKVFPSNYSVSFTGTASVPSTDFANLTFRLKSAGGVPIKTLTSATGSIELSAIRTADESDVLELVNNSSDIGPTGLSVVWSNTTATVQSMPTSMAAGTTATMTLTASDQGWIDAPMTWAQDTHPVGNPVSGAASANSTDTKNLTVTGQGTISSTVDWNTTSVSLAGVSGHGDPAASWTKNIDVSASGVVNAKIQWSNGAVPSLLRLAVLDGTVELAASNANLGDSTATLPTTSVSGTAASPHRYTFQVTDTGAPVDFSFVAGSSYYPATPNVTLELWNGAGTVKLASSSTDVGVKPKQVTYDMVANNAQPGTYKLKVISHNYYAQYSGTATLPTLAYANVTLNLKKADGGLVKSVTSATGAAEVLYKAPSPPEGPYTLDIVDGSSDLGLVGLNGQAASPTTRTPNLDLDLYDPNGALVASSHSTSAKPETLSYTVPANGPFGNYRYRITSADWDSSYTLSETHQVAGYATVVGRLKDSSGTVVATATSSNGTLVFDYLASGAGSYTLELQDTSSDFAVPSYTGDATGVVRRNPDLDLELYDPSGVKVASAANTAAAQPETLTYNVPAGGEGNYTFRVVSKRCDASWTLAETHSISGYATLVGRLKDSGGNTVASSTSSNGSLALDYLAGGAGSYTLELQDTSSDFAVPSYTGAASGVVQRTPNLDLELYNPSGVKVASAANTASAKPETLSYSVPAGATGDYSFKVASKDYDASWSLGESHPVSGYATVVGRLKDAGGNVVASATSSNGSLALDYAAGGLGSYTLELQDTSSDFAAPSVSGSATGVQQRYGTFDFKLKDGTGSVVATGTSDRPSALTANVAPGGYTLSMTPVTGAGTATLSGSYPRAAKEVIAYDGRDHATSTDDGVQTVAETLAPSGRVLERKVTDDATGAVVEDTIFGYDDDGDSPAYSMPAGGGPVTTFVTGPDGLLLTDVGGTATWSIVNAHGDLVATADLNGNVTPLTSLADEFGAGSASSSRLGWLGGKERFSTGGSLGLVRMGVRLYDPALGRFLETDPVEGGSCNKYDYVCADPVNGFDLMGLAKGGKQNVRDSGLQDKTDEEIMDGAKNLKGKEKRRYQKELKARGLKHSTQSEFSAVAGAIGSGVKAVGRGAVRAARGAAHVAKNVGRGTVAAVAGVTACVLIVYHWLTESGIAYAM